MTPALHIVCVLFVFAFVCPDVHNFSLAFNCGRPASNMINKHERQTALGAGWARGSSRRIGVKAPSPHLVLTRSKGREALELSMTGGDALALGTGKRRDLYEFVTQGGTEYEVNLSPHARAKYLRSNKGIAVIGGVAFFASTLSTLRGVFKLADYRTTTGHDLRLNVETLQSTRRETPPLPKTPQKKKGLADTTTHSSGPDHVNLEGGVLAGRELDWVEQIRRASQLPEVEIDPLEGAGSTRERKAYQGDTAVDECGTNE